MHPVIGCRTKTVKGRKSPPAIERQFYTQNHRESLLVAVIEGKSSAVRVHYRTTASIAAVCKADR